MPKKKRRSLVQWGSKNWNGYKIKRSKIGYWDWLSNSQNRKSAPQKEEPDRANPDSKIEEEKTTVISNFAIEDFEQFLTENQYLIVVMKFKYKLTLSEISRRMRKCRSTIQEVYNASVKKITRYLEDLEDHPRVL